MSTFENDNEMGNLKSKLIAKDDQIIRLQSQYDKLYHETSQTIKELQNSISTKDCEIVDLQQLVKVFKSNDDSTNQSDQLLKENSLLHMRVSSLEQSVQEHERAKQQLLFELKEVNLKYEHTKLRSNVSETVFDVIGNLEVLSPEEMKEKIKELYSKLEEKIKEIDDIENNAIMLINEKETENIELRNEMDKLMVSHREEIIEWQTIVEDLQVKIDENVCH